ncbi:MAG TPA: PLP-dependent aspartate aminotransferase family protein [Candidatus Competibacteraceae bacterium]|nr:PLP-dependent aspartate aminotransferase family protein [Candidatus Competibacteraceae bacterium]
MPKFDTLSVHAGYQPDATGALMPPIYANSTFAQRAPGEHSGFEYGRSQNPTRFVFERAVAALEGGTRGYAFASGLAAMATVLDLLPQGSHVVALDDLYGGSWRLFERVRRPSAGLEVSYVPPQDPQRILDAITPRTRMLWLETPTNPLLKLSDLAVLGAEARRRGILSVVDNTFASPWLQRPLEHGFDLVLHSATKYLNGHSDVIAGVVVVGDNPELAERLGYLQNAVGAILGPFDSFLAVRGLRTLGLRMRAHCANALALAQWLEQQPQVERVLYPGLPSHPQHALARRQMSGGYGGVVSVYLAGDGAATRRFLQSVKVFTLAESLGGVESLVNLPALMTHGSLPAERRAALGITDNLVRLSVGIEDMEDLQADLEQALATI